MTSSSQSGNALLPSVVVAILLAGLAGSVVTVVNSGSSENKAAAQLLQAQYLAESGARLAIENLTAGGTGVLGSEQAPQALGSGSYYTEVSIDGTLTVVDALATVGDRSIRVECTLEGEPALFQNAISAGNSSGDPSYVLDLGGTGKQADVVTGDIYSGGDILLKGDANVDGILRSAGKIDGATGYEGVPQKVVDLKAMNYEVNHDYDVASEFSLYSSYKANSAGGSAYQVPENLASHIFRKNPSDRTTETKSTVKDDYFLEDPYEKVTVDKNQNGTDAYVVTMSGTASEPGPDSNHAVFYIDGNLWIHNKMTYSLKFKTSADMEGLQVTFVVKGNIYISDNLFYTNINKDAVAFIALADEKVADSGNIYFGDPVFGTLKRMEGLMYAENNFFDTNLDASGSETVELFGVMSAGNQVAIDRDYGSAHTKLTVTFDDRVANGEVDVPGLPGASAGAQEYTVIGWRTLGADSK